MDRGLPVNFRLDFHIMVSFNTSMEIPMKDTYINANLMAKGFGKNKTALLMDNFNMEILFMVQSHMLMAQSIEVI